MFKKNRPSKTTIKVNTSYEGETIEQKIRRIVNNKEPISDGAPLIYTERNKGVLPEHDIRTDKMEIAVDAMDKVAKTHIAKREDRHKPKTDPKDPKDQQTGGNDQTKNDGGAEPTQTTTK